MNSRRNVGGHSSWLRSLTLGVGLVALAGVAATDRPASAGGGGGGGGTPISTQGVVVFGSVIHAPTDGTYRMNPDGTALALVTTQWYPNDVSRGQTPVTILVNSGWDIYAQRADGTGSPVALLITPTNETQLRFSPDGTKIAYATVIAGIPNTYTISTADVLRDGANDVVELANTQVVWSGLVQTRGLDFSRDGSRIVFAPSTATYDLYVVRLSDGNLEQLTNTAAVEEYPRWSPTDDRIVFQQRANPATGISSVLTIDYATRATKTVVSGRSQLYASFPCWSPDARNVLVLAGGSTVSSDLYQYPAGGGKGVNVTGGTSLQLNVPSWGW